MGSFRLRGENVVFVRDDEHKIAPFFMTALLRLSTRRNLAAGELLSVILAPHSYARLA